RRGVDGLVVEGGEELGDEEAEERPRVQVVCWLEWFHDASTGRERGRKSYYTAPRPPGQRPIRDACKSRLICALRLRQAVVASPPRAGRITSVIVSLLGWAGSRRSMCSSMSVTCAGAWATPPSLLDPLLLDPPSRPNPPDVQPSIPSF